MNRASRSIVVALAGVALTTPCAANATDYSKIGKQANPPRLTVSPDFQTRFKDPNSGAALRHEFAYTLIAQSDADCEDYLVGISVVQGRVGGSLSVTSLLLSTIATITTPLRSAHLLSAGSTALSGSEKALKDTVFGGNEYRLLYTAVKSGREERRRQLFADIEGGAYDTWSAESIAAHLTPYHLNCGINFGLERLEAATKELAAKPAGPPPTPSPPLAPAAPAPAALPAPAAPAVAPPPPVVPSPGPRPPRS
jgi:hypothetical protein